MSEPLTLFQHLPKTGGTSIRSAVRKQLGEQAVLETKRLPLAKEASIFLQHRADLPVRFVGAHFPYGVHEKLDRSCRYVTILRHPVDRLASLFHHERKLTTSPTRHWDLKEFVQRLDEVRVGNHNQQARMISTGSMWLGEENLELAKRRLKEYALVGVMEQYEVFADRLFQLLGSERPERLPTERSGASPRDHKPGDKYDVSDEARDVICEMDAIDLELYEFARELAA